LTFDLLASPKLVNIVNNGPENVRLCVSPIQKQT